MEIPWSMGPTAVAAFIVFIGVLIFVHELGHFLVAKLFDIKVVKFSLGFGPTLLSFTRGETTYQIAAIPLGGYVKMIGDNPVEQVDPRDLERSFSGAPVYQRALVAVAGPLFNLAFPVICFFAFFVLEHEVTPPRVGAVEHGRPAEQAGLRGGDLIVAIGDDDVQSFGRLIELVGDRPQEPLQLTIDRNGEKKSFEVTPDATASTDLFGRPKTRGLIGVVSVRPGTRIGLITPGRDGLQTGDRLLAIAERPVAAWDEVLGRLNEVAGSTVALVVARPRLVGAGGLLAAEREDVFTKQVFVPQAPEPAEALGWRPSETFLRNVIAEGAADKAGLKTGDEVVAVAGKPVRMLWSYRQALRGSKGKGVAVTYRRGGSLHETEVTPRKLTCINDATRKPAEVWSWGLGMQPPGPEASCTELGRALSFDNNWSSIGPLERQKVRLPITEAVRASFRATSRAIVLTAVVLYKLFSAEIAVENVGGPLRLFKVAAQAAEVGLLQYLQMMALISVNLGLINLLPIVPLDGGHLLFCLIEAIKRRPVSMQARQIAGTIGLVLVLALILLAFRNDIIELGLL